ncbi:orotidine 5'-phosphate decarboxylase [Heliomicrobium modesticaldum Ice1]|uniref:Orotidine 5'-phosphate decarboxylase n=1 Tax=Heliobacterium modesticaldum (strain ATCC 51547 / Ice1) TaxID=498761 RepID=PYRF_HELMI|nr:orotidine-5'-phosphate decarboxylase [Heliomicrobium modesticaldum]B0TDZ7.1 RecName: Full=Orotidine 5'-phosphate decarboxylase; AltName: Full=OMP decarboxylase; Short=OMPDCase; Short=OMPdecase [Heliomicrobium modesticaldum Ice1]ABZ82860.1 orotidine 5'-phosphate decarboxylase [Heliomicrobium modesticaldum Ice1]
MEAKDRLIVALDVDTRDEAISIVNAVGEHCGLFKVGMQLHNSAGFAVTEEILSMGFPVFLDLKFHDIPNTVGKAATVVSRRGVKMFTVHAAGGREMLRQAVKGAREGQGERRSGGPLVLAITVLTSVSQAVLHDEVGLPGSVEENVVRFARLAQAAGVQGVVASPQEIRPIRAACGDDFVIVTPGVRPLWAGTDDQARIMTPAKAMEAGATYLVVGRPITAAPSRAEAAKRIVEEMAEGLARR